MAMLLYGSGLRLMEALTLRVKDLDFAWLQLTGPHPPAALSRRIQAAWTAFATTGNPTAPGEPPWPRYTAETRATMLLTDGAWTVVGDPKAGARRLLRAMYEVGQ